MAINRLLAHFLSQGEERGGLDAVALSLPAVDETTRQLVSRYVEEYSDRFPRPRRLEDLEAGRTIEQLPPDGKLRVLYAAYARMAGPLSRGDVANCHMATDGLCGMLLRGGLPHTAEGLAAMLAGVVKPTTEGSFSLVPLQALLRATARHVKKHGTTPGIDAALGSLRAACKRHAKSDQAVHALETLDEIAGRTPPAPPPLKVEGGEAWADAVIADLADVSPEERAAWTDLLAYCRTATPSHPTKKWLAAAKERVEKVGGGSFAALAGKWLPMVDLPRTKTVRHHDGGWLPDPNHLIADESADLLKGLAWCCATLDDAQLARALADCAQASFKKIRWKGPRCPKLGNACLDALAAMPNAEAAAQLSRLSTSVKQPTGKRTVTKAIANLANRTHQTPEDLEELAVPTYEMTTPGVVERAVGGFAARFDFRTPSEPAITYTSSRGKVQKSAPAEVKSEPALKAFQKLAKDVEKMFDAQRLRVERLLMSDRSWPLEQWKRRYLDHPLLAPLTSRLIWTFTSPRGQTTTAIPRDGGFVTEGGKPFEPAGESTVRLWHPVGATAELVLAWRTFLQDREVTQPFKQAHREIYIITDAELRTSTYSNRFAAHVIRQQQFRALCQQRGWKVGLVGTWDSGGDTTPTLELPRYGLRVQFWVDAANAGDVDDTGVITHLTTDQARFYRAGEAEPLRLSDVPALVFSEVMRDIDLFVAVCSVGNDPAWQDRGEGGGMGDYWHAYSFGKLSHSAQTRREVLASLIPKLKIADRCTVGDRFVVVRGELRKYKIHLGSGNILMEPNDQYLCIVPGRGGDRAADRLFLPFEGDATLALILSKAFLLADDKSIKDPTITRQINTK